MSPVSVYLVLSSHVSQCYKWWGLLITGIQQGAGLDGLVGLIWSTGCQLMRTADVRKYNNKSTEMIHCNKTQCKNLQNKLWSQFYICLFFMVGIVCSEFWDSEAPVLSFSSSSPPPSSFSSSFSSCRPAARLSTQPLQQLLSCRSVWISASLTFLWRCWNTICDKKSAAITCVCVWAHTHTHSHTH